MDVGHWCGGVLVHNRWVITAAHCVVNPAFDQLGGAKWTVVLTELRNIEEEIRLKVSNVIAHPQFREYHNDIALLHLPPEPRLSQLSPACLPVTPELLSLTSPFSSQLGDLQGLKCMATGWAQSALEGGSKFKSAMHQVNFRIASDSYCSKMYENEYDISLKRDQHLCASPENKGSGTCVGDSGGPLHCNMADGKWYLVGITSFGSGCAKPGYPDVFTRVTSYTPWIRRTMTKYATFFPIPKWG